MKLTVQKKRTERGNTFLEFGLVAAFLVPLLGGAFTVGMSAVKAIQVSNVCRTTDVLAVQGVDLSQSGNQQLVIRAAQGLGMNQTGTNLPNTSGKGLVVVSKVILVGDTECAAGVTGATAGPPWNTGNCPNYGQYVFGMRIYIGNRSSFSSYIGNPPDAALDAHGMVSPHDIATRGGLTANHFGSGSSNVIDLGPVNSSNHFALVSEATADISYLKIFGDVALFGVNFSMSTPTVYSRNVS